MKLHLTDVGVNPAPELWVVENELAGIKVLDGRVLD